MQQIVTCLIFQLALAKILDMFLVSHVCAATFQALCLDYITLKVYFTYYMGDLPLIRVLSICTEILVPYGFL